jgi:hypothetical protein
MVTCNRKHHRLEKHGESFGIGFSPKPVNLLGQTSASHSRLRALFQRLSLNLELIMKIKSWNNIHNKLALLPVSLRGKSKPRDRFAGSKRRDWTYNKRNAAPSVCIITKPTE